MKVTESPANIQNPAWQRFIEPSLPGQISIWKIDLDTFGAQGFFHILSQDEQERAASFRFPFLQQRFIACRGALRCLLGSALECSPREIEFSYSTSGKPSIRGSPIHFNVAHSENLALVALAPVPVGIDVERIRAVEFDSLAAAVFSPAELSAWKSVSSRKEAFYGLWTRKEALLKGIGCGFTHFLQDVSVYFDDSQPIELGPRISIETWKLRSFRVSSDYPAAVAWMAT